MEGQTTSADAATADTSTTSEATGGDAETSEAKTTTEQTAESGGSGDTLVTGSDVKADAADATETAETGDADKTDEGETGGEQPPADAKKTEADVKADGDEKTDDADATADADSDDTTSEGDNLDGLPEGFDWRALATDEKSRNRLGQFESMDDLAKFVREADSWRRKAVIPPNSKSSPEDVKRFHKAIGVPESPSGYEVELSPDATDADKERVDRLRMAAHGVHVTPQQLGAMIEWHQAETEAIEAREAEAVEQQLAEAKTELARTWGPDYQRNAGLAVQTWKRGGADQFVEDWGNLELKDGTKLGNHPWTMQIGAKLGRMFGEAGVPGEVMPSDWAPSEADLIEMQKTPEYLAGDKAVHAKVKLGYQRLYSN